MSVTRRRSRKYRRRCLHCGVAFWGWTAESMFCGRPHAAAARSRWHREGRDKAVERVYPPRAFDSGVRAGFSIADLANGAVPVKIGVTS